jgi:hypothetical protein
VEDADLIQRPAHPQFVSTFPSVELILESNYLSTQEKIQIPVTVLPTSSVSVGRICHRVRVILAHVVCGPCMALEQAQWLQLRTVANERHNRIK